MENVQVTLEWRVSKTGLIRTQSLPIKFPKRPVKAQMKCGKLYEKKELLLLFMCECGAVDVGIPKLVISSSSGYHKNKRTFLMYG